MYHLFYLAYITGHFLLPIIFPKKKKLMLPLIHVEDLARATIFLAEKKEAENEAFNVANDSPLQEQWIQTLYEAAGASYTIVPSPWVIYKFVSKIIFKLGARKANKAHKYGIRTKFDLPALGYLTHQYYFSNKKLKSMGYEFMYNDYVKGTYETVEWYKEKGWFPKTRMEIPKFVKLEPKLPKKPKTEYKTPMEGGDIF
jgi:nucleoside-diphosphate-sugar epimerase